MKPIRAILEYFRIKKTIRYHGTMGNLERILEAMENERLEKEEFYLNRTESCKYRLNPIVSFGTVQMSTNDMLVHTNKITVEIDLDSKSSGLQEIHLKGARHKGHFLIFFVFVFLLLVFTATVARETIIPLYFVMALWIVSHLWFNFVWTSQEKDLIEEVKLALHVRIRAGIGLEKDVT
jgi:hypothetical protein